MHWLNIWNFHCIDTSLMISHNFYALPAPVIIIKWSNRIPDMGPTNPQGFRAPFWHLIDFFITFLLSCLCIYSPISYLVLFVCWVSMSVLICPALNYPSILYKWQINEWKWTCNRMPSERRNGIIYAFPNFNGCTVEVWDWISNFIPHIILDGVTYPCRD